MGAFGIQAECPSTSVNDYHTFSYATARTSGTIFAIHAGPSATSVFKLFLTALGDVVPGPFSATDLSTTATDGFLYTRSGNGAPTGVPSLAGNGRVATYYDRANNKFYVYNGGWKGVTLS